MVENNQGGGEIPKELRNFFSFLLNAVKDEYADLDPATWVFYIDGVEVAQGLDEKLLLDELQKKYPDKTIFRKQLNNEFEEPPLGLFESGRRN